MNYKLQEVKAVLPRVVSAIVCKLPLFRAVPKRPHFGGDLPFYYSLPGRSRMHIFPTSYGDSIVPNVEKNCSV